MLTADELDDVAMAIAGQDVSEHKVEFDRLLEAGAVLVEPRDLLQQREAAEVLGCDRSTVLRWLREGVMPKPWKDDLRTGPLWLRADVEAFRDRRAADPPRPGPPPRPAPAA